MEDAAGRPPATTTTAPPPAPAAGSGLDGEELVLSLRMMSGEPIGPALRIPDSALVVELKRLATASLPGCSARSLQLLWEGCLLEDGACLRDVGVHSGAELQLVMASFRHFRSVLRCRPDTPRERDLFGLRAPALSLDPRHGVATMMQAIGEDAAKERVFELDAVYPENCTQEEVFEGSVRGLVRGALQGRTCTIVAFGPTGSGKRHAVFGGPSTEEEGILPRTFEALAEGIAERPGEMFVLRASFALVYGSGAYDLLAEDTSARLRVREGPDKRTRVEGLSSRAARCAGELRAALAEGLAALERRMWATGGCQSRRWSLVFTIEVESHEASAARGWRAGRSARIHVVKTGGSERERPALFATALRDVQDLQDVRALQRTVCMLANSQQREQKRVFIPWRDARLTHMLKDPFLHGDVLFLFTCARHEFCQDDTQSTLRFAEVVRQVRFPASGVPAAEEAPSEQHDEPLCASMWIGRPGACVDYAALGVACA